MHYIKNYTTNKGKIINKINPPKIIQIIIKILNKIDFIFYYISNLIIFYFFHLFLDMMSKRVHSKSHRIYCKIKFYNYYIWDDHIRQFFRSKYHILDIVGKIMAYLKYDFEQIFISTFNFHVITYSTYYTF